MYFELLFPVKLKALSLVPVPTPFFVVVSDKFMFPVESCVIKTSSVKQIKTTQPVPMTAPAFGVRDVNENHIFGLNLFSEKQN